MNYGLFTHILKGTSLVALFVVLLQVRQVVTVAVGVAALDVAAEVLVRQRQQVTGVAIAFGFGHGVQILDDAAQRVEAFALLVHFGNLRGGRQALLVHTGSRGGRRRCGCGVRPRPGPGPGPQQRLGPPARVVHRPGPWPGHRVGPLL